MYEVVGTPPNHTLRPLNGPYEVSGALTIDVTKPLQPKDSGESQAPDPPVIHSAADPSPTAMLTRTSAQVNWDAPITGVQAVQWEVWRDNALVTTVNASVLTYTETGLPTATPERIFAYSVRGVGPSGPGGYSATVTLQWNATPPQVPTAPLTLVRSNLTDTSVSLTWTEDVDATVTKHTVRSSTGTVMKDNIAPDVLTTSLTGLSANTAYTVYVTRTNGVGESGPSPSRSFTTTGGPPQGIPLMGVSTTSTDHKFAQWDVVRTYNFSQAAGDVSSYGAVVCALTDGGTSPQGGQAAANALDAFLLQFYGKTGAPSAHVNVEIHFAHGNEIAKDAPYLSGTLPAAFVNTYALSRPVIDKYDKASLWVDMTQDKIRNNGAGPRFKAIAQYLDGMACSMYPPGRNSQPTVFTAYATYSQEPLDTVIDWHASFPICSRFATWEWGTPVDHCTAWGANAGGAVTGSTDLTKRPSYTTGYLDYVYAYLTAAGVEMGPQVYWDNQTSQAAFGPPNQLFHDNGLVTPDTATAWHNWVP